MKTYWIPLLGALTIGCVTQTERIPYHRYYDPPENESVLDELRREFGWQKPPPWVHEEPLYKRAAQGVKKTITGWFQQDTTTGPFPDGLQTVREFQQVQNEAIQRSKQRNAEEGSQIGGPSGLINDSLTPNPRGEVPKE
jgi:hypothetical protein